MNKTIKSIHEQIEPDKRVVDDLLNQIENGRRRAEVVKGGGFRWLYKALPVAAVFAVAVAAAAAALDTDKDGLVTAQKALEDTETAASLESETAELDAELFSEAEDAAADALDGCEEEYEPWVLYLERLDGGEDAADSVSYTGIFDPEDDEMETALLKYNEQATFDGAVYDFDSGFTSSVDQVGGLIGSGHVYIPDSGDSSAYVYGTGDSAVGREILVTLDGEMFYLYVNQSYEAEFSSVDLVFEPYGGEDGSFEMYTYLSTGKENTIPAMMEKFKETGTFEYDGSVFEYAADIADDYTEYAPDMSLSDRTASGYIYGESDGYTELWNAAIFDASDDFAAGYIYVLLEDGSMYLFTDTVNTTDQSEVSEWVITVYDGVIPESMTAESVELSETARSKLLQANETLSFGDTLYEYAEEIIATGDLGEMIGSGKTARGNKVYVYTTERSDFEIAVYLKEDISYVYTPKIDDLLSSVTYDIENTYDDNDEYSRADIARIIDTASKYMIFTALNTVTISGTEYECTYKLRNTGYSSFTCIADGVITVGGDTSYELWIYRAEDDKDTIYLDIGDGQGVSYVRK